MKLSVSPLHGGCGKRAEGILPTGETRVRRKSPKEACVGTVWHHRRPLASEENTDLYLDFTFLYFSSLRAGAAVKTSPRHLQTTPLVCVCCCFALLSLSQRPCRHPDVEVTRLEAVLLSSVSRAASPLALAFAPNIGRRKTEIEATSSQRYGYKG